MENKAYEVRALLSSSSSIVALTGAGISTSAGIPDFRGPSGIYAARQYDPEKVFEISHFLFDQKPFYDFAKEFLNGLKKVEPTFAHCWLSKLEETGRLKGIITQNIDGLHQRAGSKNVLELHGSFQKSCCMKCGRTFSLEEFEKIMPKRCSCGGIIKPDIVFFGEPVKHFYEATELARNSDLFLVIGSSLTVYPAAYFPTIAEGPIVIVNKGKILDDPLSFGSKCEYIDHDIDEFLKMID
jgi:NAD-dependent protein deacetylases, SIR2 family